MKGKLYLKDELDSPGELLCELLERKLGGRCNVEAVEASSLSFSIINVHFKIKHLPLNQEELALVIWSIIDQKHAAEEENNMQDSYAGMVWIDKNRNLFSDNYNGDEDLQYRQLTIGDGYIYYDETDIDTKLTYETQICGWIKENQILLDEALEVFKNKRPSQEEVNSWLKSKVSLEGGIDEDFNS